MAGPVARACIGGSTAHGIAHLPRSNHLDSWVRAGKVGAEVGQLDDGGELVHRHAECAAELKALIGGGICDGRGHSDWTRRASVCPNAPVEVRSQDANERGLSTEAGCTEMAVPPVAIRSSMSSTRSSGTSAPSRTHILSGWQSTPTGAWRQRMRSAAARGGRGRSAAARGGRGRRRSRRSRSRRRRRRKPDVKTVGRGRGAVWRARGQWKAGSAHSCS